MDNNKYLELINENEDKIIEMAADAYEEALNNKHLRFIVEIDKDGEVSYWNDIAGGNSQHMSVYNGDAIELLHFCFQYSDLEITQDDIINKLIEMGFENKIDELLAEARDENEDFPDLEWAINNHNDDVELIRVLEECRKDAIKLECENANEVIEDKLDLVKCNLIGR